MSADNGVYILITSDKFVQANDKGGFVNTNGKPVKAYRVVHAQAIDNFDYYKEHEPHNLGAYMWDTWGSCEVFYDKTKALVEAQRIVDTFEFVEYGVAEIDASEYNFYMY